TRSVVQEDLHEMNSLFDSLYANYTEYSDISYANKEGKDQVSTVENEGIDVSDRVYFKRAQQGYTHISEVLIDKVSQEQIITLTSPVFNDENEFNGVVIGVVSLDTIQKLMGKLTDVTGEAYIVDKDGVLITQTSREILGGKIDSPIFQAAKSNEQMSSLYEVEDGKSVLGHYVWVHGGQWLIIGESYKKDVYATFNQLMLIFFIGFLVLSLIGSLMILSLFRQTERPILQVLEGTSKMGEGIWDFRLEEDEFDVKELRELGINFNMMASLIEKHVYNLSKSEKRFRTIAEYSSDMISIHDLKGNYLYVSPAGQEMLGYSEAEIFGDLRVDWIHPDDVERIYQEQKELFKHGYAVFTYRIRKKQGGYLWLETSMKKSQTKGENYIYGISRNITERKEAEAQLKEANNILMQLSSKDGLTGIWNRRTFDEDYHKTWTEAITARKNISLMLLDIDYFKKYNDTYGHQTGDDCLVEIANTIEKTAQVNGCRAYRYGGEEFVVIISALSAREAKKIAEEIREAVERLAIPHISSSVKPYVTISGGVHTITPTVEKHPLEFLKET